MQKQQGALPLRLTTATEATQDMEGELVTTRKDTENAHAERDLALVESETAQKEREKVRTKTGVAQVGRDLAWAETETARNEWDATRKETETVWMDLGTTDVEADTLRTEWDQALAKGDARKVALMLAQDNIRGLEGDVEPRSATMASGQEEIDGQPAENEGVEEDRVLVMSTVQRFRCDMRDQERQFEEWFRVRDAILQWVLFVVRLAMRSGDINISTVMEAGLPAAENQLPLVLAGSMCWNVTRIRY